MDRFKVTFSGGIALHLFCSRAVIKKCLSLRGDGGLEKECNTVKTPCQTAFRLTFATRLC
jgi:hypothetical protein